MQAILHSSLKNAWKLRKSCFVPCSFTLPTWFRTTLTGELSIKTGIFDTKLGLDSEDLAGALNVRS